MTRTHTTGSTLVRGRKAVLLDSQRRAELPTKRLAAAVACSSGRVSTWEGTPLDVLVEAADAPPDTTHLAVTAADDCHVYVAVGDALDGLLAVRRDGDALDAPRLVAPGIDGVQSVKDVVELEATTLSPAESPHEYERHPADEAGD